jgi:hypothetical protein
MAGIVNRDARRREPRDMRETQKRAQQASFSRQLYAICISFYAAWRRRFF